MSHLYHNGYPVISIDADFIEHLIENGYDETIPYENLLVEYATWEKEVI